MKFCQLRRSNQTIFVLGKSPQSTPNGLKCPITFCCNWAKISKWNTGDWHWFQIPNTFFLIPNSLSYFMYPIQYPIYVLIGWMLLVGVCPKNLSDGCLWVLRAKLVEAKQHLHMWHLSISKISQLLLTRFWWNFKGRFLGTSRTESNCHRDICPCNICPDDNCPYQEYLSCW